MSGPRRRRLPRRLRRPPWPAGEPLVALVGARLVDGTGDPVVHDAVVVVNCGRLADVGSGVRVPNGAHVVDLGGATVTPGVIDAHVHLALAGGPAGLLRSGVTAVRDLGWPPDRLAPLVGAGRSAGLLVTWVGPILTARGGYPARAAWAPPGTACEIGGADDAVQAVDRVVGLGACAVKVGLDDRHGPLLAPGTLAAVVERAGALGRVVTAHVGSADALRRALDAGVGELAHVPFSAAPVPEDLVRRAVRAGVRLVPTLHCREADPADQRQAAAGFLRQWVGLGGLVAYGTDLGNACTSPGVDGRELALLAASGMTPAAVVAAATGGAAVAAGVSETTGRVAPGLRADLLVLDADPLVDPTALARPRWVVAGGRPVAW